MTTVVWHLKAQAEHIMAIGCKITSSEGTECPPRQLLLDAEAGHPHPMSQRSVLLYLNPKLVTFGMGLMYGGHKCSDNMN